MRAESICSTASNCRQKPDFLRSGKLCEITSSDRSAKYLQFASSAGRSVRGNRWWFCWDELRRSRASSPFCFDGARWYKFLISDWGRCRVELALCYDPVLILQWEPCSTVLLAAGHNSNLCAKKPRLLWSTFCCISHNKSSFMSFHFWWLFAKKCKHFQCLSAWKYGLLILQPAFLSRMTWVTYFRHAPDMGINQW